MLYTGKTVTADEARQHNSASGYSPARRPRVLQRFLRRVSSKKKKIKKARVLQRFLRSVSSNNNKKKTFLNDFYVVYAF